MNLIERAKCLITNYHQMMDESKKSDTLRELKILMLDLRTLPPSNEPINKDEFLIARNIIELEMESYLNKKDEGRNSFELSYLRVKQFYFDYKNLLPRSDKMLYFVGLYLLHLLASNRTSEFCTELELLDLNDLKDRYICISRDLESCIMDGNYKHIASIKKTAEKLPHYNFFLEKLDDAIKVEIARSIETSYESISVKTCLDLLMLKNTNELSAYIKNDTETLKDRKIDWKILNDRIYFNPIKQEKMSIPSHAIIDEIVNMGVEIEKII